MARLPRLTFAGQPHLAVLQALDTQALFVDDEDRRRFLLAMLESARACELHVHAYVLLDQQVLLLVTPVRADSMVQFMQRLGRRYVAAFNRRHGRQGPLWSRRYGAATVDPASQVWRCIKLIEQAPVRAGRVARPQDWPWSSASHHMGRQRQSLIKEHEQHWRLGNTPFEREAKHAQLLAEPIATAEADALVAAALRGWPIGPRHFVDALAESSEHALRPRARGRPRASDAST